MRSKCATLWVPCDASGPRHEGARASVGVGVRTERRTNSFHRFVRPSLPRRGSATWRAASLTRAMLAWLGLAPIAIALYSRFRSLPDALVVEYAAFMQQFGGTATLGNNALKHHHAATEFCRQRVSGCTWAEHHALVDASREPWSHLFDAIRIPAKLPPRPTECVRIHRPSAEDLLDLVRRAQPAVLTGLLDGWPALERWNNSYLTRHLGGAQVTVSISAGRFDHPEPPEAWGLPPSDTLEGVVSRPAHVPMSLRRALEAAHHIGATNSTVSASTDAPTAPAAAAVASGGDDASLLRAYVEYQPIDQLLATSDARSASSSEQPTDSSTIAAVLSHDLRAPLETTSRAKASERDAAVLATAAAAATAASQHRAEGSHSAPELVWRGQHEIAAIPSAEWLVPRKQLLWLGGGGTIGSTHYDPHENLMAVVSGTKVFHLAPPEDGPKLGAYSPMAEGSLRIEPRPRQARAGAGHEEVAGSGGAAFMSSHRLARSPDAVGEPLELHHYAPASLSTPAHLQPSFPRLAETTRFECVAKSGEVVYTPAYYWHEVVSLADTPTSQPPPPPADAAAEATEAAEDGPRRSVVAINWFFESFYQRVYPNNTFDRSPHYLLLDELRPLDQPFPPRARTADRQRSRPRSRQPKERRQSADAGERLPEPAVPGGQQAAASAASSEPAAPRFYARLRQRAGEGSPPPSPVAAGDDQKSCSESES